MVLAMPWLINTRLQSIANWRVRTGMRARPSSAVGSLDMGVSGFIFQGDNTPGRNFCQVPCGWNQLCYVEAGPGGPGKCGRRRDGGNWMFWAAMKMIQPNCRVQFTAQ